MTLENVIALGLFAVFVVILLGMAIRIVPEYRRLVVFRLGRVIGAQGPGLALLIPFSEDDRASRRTQVAPSGALREARLDRQGNDDLSGTDDDPPQGG